MNPPNLKALAEQIAIPVSHLRYLLEQIEWHIPKATVWVFGSRVKWSHRQESDLDIAVLCDKETARKGLPKLNDALDESDLPFKVQLLDFNRLTANMQENIKKDYIVLYQPTEKQLPSRWKETMLEEVAEFSNGRTSPERFDSGKYEVFGSNGVIGLSDETNSDANTIIIGRVGSYCGSLYFSKNKCWVTDNAIKANAKKTSDPFYLYYLLTTQKLNSKAAGSGQPLINQEILNSIEVTIPLLPEQKAIAAILSSFDDKIELLRRQNKTLESMAQTIFKEWFVKFNFPVEFEVKSEKLKVKSKKGLPEGWRGGKLTDVIDVSPDRNLRKGELAPYLDMKGMPTQGHHAEGWYKREFTSGSKFINGDTLLARITPCLENGKTAFVDFLDEDQVGWGSTEFIVLRPKLPFTPFYGYLLARSDPFRNFAIGQMTGTSGRQRVPEDSLGNLDVIIPTGNIMAKFGELIKPIEKRLTMNAKQIQTLSKLRDALLPKLMKGEIRVRN